MNYGNGEDISNRLDENEVEQDSDFVDPVGRWIGLLDLSFEKHEAIVSHFVVGQFKSRECNGCLETKVLTICVSVNHS